MNDQNVGVYFDESIFDGGFALRDYSTVRANNAADRFLAERLNKRCVMDPCEDDEGDSTGTDEPDDAYTDNTIININPRYPCRGINVYTLNIINKEVISTMPFNRISIETEGDFYPIFVGEPTAVGVDRYTVGKLSPLESALMLKYFAIRGKVAISIELYLLVNRHFVDYRKWFEFGEDVGVVEAHDHTLSLGGKSLNDNSVFLDFYGPPLKLV